MAFLFVFLQEIGVALASTVSVLLDHADYAYVAHPDFPEGKPLVSDIY
jgi:hypothetical protein